MMRGKVKIARLPGELAEEMERAAEAGGISRSSFGNVLLSIWINEVQNEGLDPYIEKLPIRDSDRRVSLSMSKRLYYIMRQISLRKGCKANDVIAHGIEAGLERWKVFDSVPNALSNRKQMETLFSGGEGNLQAAGRK